MDKVLYKTLLDEYGKHIPYPLLLRCDEWRKRRNEIIIRDASICLNCKKRGFDIIHFGKPYIVDLVPVTYNVNPFGEELIELEEMGLVLQDEYIILHVHHKYYYLDKLPWEYDDDALVTLCQTCHEKLHKNEIIPVYSTSNSLVNMNLKPCIKCDGIGEFEQYKHIQNGICFRCHGRRYEELININIDNIS